MRPAKEPPVPARIPKPGEAIKIKAAKVPAFKPGKALKDAVNGAK